MAENAAPGLISELLLQRGTKKVATGLVLNRDKRLTRPENSADYVSRELCAHSIRKLQAHVLFIKFQFVEVPGNHCVHMCEPQHVASIISSFLQRTHTLPAQL
ncbi:SERHL2 isoform 5 [Pongo abelii]|uniref:SERHL2 isoform 5 n=1 Tax=Pongo abelii TaxID=9601 RepID=A0A2J8TWG5_PONAB|nr:SERHL2 isoform 5 [Pongo abelii]